MKNRTIILSLILLLPFVPSMAQERDDERVLICYETPKPRFNGDDANNFKNWVDKHKCYPEEARKAGIEGRVTTLFTITKEGKLTKVRILRGIHPLLDQEAVRVIESAPQLWEPGKNHKGETEEMSLVFPVIFDGATKSFIIWISNNLNYPEDARKSGLEGRVYVKFKINELGKMVDAAVDCSTDKIFEDEALRVVKSAQDKWKPGRDATGKPVALGYAKLLRIDDVLCLKQRNTTGTGLSSLSFSPLSRLLSAHCVQWSIMLLTLICSTLSAITLRVSQNQSMKYCCQLRPI